MSSLASSGPLTKRNPEGETDQFQRASEPSAFPITKTIHEGHRGFLLLLGWFSVWGFGFLMVFLSRERRKANCGLFNEMQYTELGHKDALYCTDLHRGLILSGSVTCTVNHEYY